MKKVGIYIRVSTQEQANEGYSIPAQRDKLISYCKAKEWMIFDIYIDDGYTGTDTNRPGLQKLLENIKNIDTVLVYKLDRLSRSQKDVLYLAEEKFIKNNVDFVSVLESFDTSTPFGRAMLGILAVFAQLERETIIERSRLGKKEQAKQGKWRGGTLPLGYDYIDGKLQINEYEGTIIKKIFELYIDGLGMDSIAKNLNKEGYRSKQNTKFTANKIRSYLNNPIYAGYIPYKDEIFEGIHKEIISKSTFDLTRSLMKARSKNYRKTSNALLGGLIFCGECGARMFRKKVKKYDYYICYTYHGGPSHMVTSKKCDLGYMNCDTLEKEVVSQIHYFENDQYALDTLIENVLKRNKSTMDDSAISNLEKELSDIEKELSRWYDAYGKGHMDFNVVNERVKIGLKKKETIKKQIRSILEHNIEIKKTQIEPNDLKQIIQNFHLIWNHATHEEKRKILKGFIKSITVFRDQSPFINFRTD